MDFNSENFVTVVSIGNELQTGNHLDPESLEYITVLTIGDPEKDAVTEEVLVYRLPGERLGFGLKFEGGTKANEFVKRLFIQSCAPDSPASRVESSWGTLTEGDEVLEIDAIAVNTMTRIDCVRCLKDSNVVIKLLVKHFGLLAKSEGLPQVISAEKKRTPPPPPPVPPRKIPKKGSKNQALPTQNSPVPAARQITDSNSKKFQSPRSSGRMSHSPEVAKRDRRLSEGNIVPPDAEVYLDLFSQESIQSLSESDDTGSSISTVVDRFGSFPTTTTSSLAGSLPSTPTSIQKHLDFTNLLNYYDDEDLTILTKNLNKQLGKFEKGNEDSTPLQPPSCFQDAPLSYGNEDMNLIDTKTDNEKRKVCKKPPVPPRSRDLIKITGCKDICDENMNISNLPRLVDFVPKSNTGSLENLAEISNAFLETERKEIFEDFIGTDLEIDMYSSKWSLSQLATIGEDEEESCCDRSPLSSTPIVIVENANFYDDRDTPSKLNEGINEKMEALPSDSRQPPDGHESPDFVESGSLRDNHQDPYNSRLLKTFKSAENVAASETKSSFNDYHNETKSLLKTSSNSDLRMNPFDSGGEEVTLRVPSIKPHVRSQSLIDVSAIPKAKPDRWSSIMEQRKRCYSKLKGLIIPENMATVEPATEVNIPEIISHSTFIPQVKPDASDITPNHRRKVEPVVLPLVSPSWTAPAPAIPKYSPAFKRRTLEVYTQPKPPKPDHIAIKPIELEKEKCAKIKTRLDSEDLRLELLDSPKSLESITSPTRSDCSFDYITTPSYKSKKTLQLQKGKSEDESDNDSAVSSSQSSYISKYSPPPSPTRLYDTVDDDTKTKTGANRLLKPASVEAINRKNILASAKCRSGRDLKVGSPVIQRKYDENESIEKTKPVLASTNGTLNTRTDTKPRSTVTHFAVQLKETKITPKVEIRPNSLMTNQPKTVTDIRKSFEKFGGSPPPLPQNVPHFSTKEVKETKIPVKKPLQDPKTPIKEDLKIELAEPVENAPGLRRTVTLCPKFLGGSIGITLAGGTDYETKEITVHKIRYGSVAYNDGNIKKGDRVISINGRSTAVLTHAESVEMLKESVPVFEFVLEDGKDEPAASPKRRSRDYDLPEPTEKREEVTSTKTVTHVITLVKDGGGLGFSIEGGKDSPTGDQPLRVKKIFQGGAADKSGELHVGDELLAINAVDLINLSRIETWSLMKKLPEGNVSIHIHR